jgi:hypothetical protein
VLHAASLDGSFIYNTLEIFQLDRGMNSSILLVVDSVLMHDEDDGTMLRVSIGTDGTNLDLRQLMVVEASDVDSTSLL